MALLMELLKSTAHKGTRTLALLIFIGAAELLKCSTMLKVSGMLENSKPPAFTVKHGFIENKSQDKYLDGKVASSVKYTYKQNGIRILLTENGISYQFSKFSADRSSAELYRADMKLQHCNTSAKITASEKLPGAVIFREGEKEFTAEHFAKVTYHNIYPNIDWVIYLNDGKIKYDFIVKPGGDASHIILKFEHFDDLVKDNNGGISASSPLGKVGENKPLSYQDKKEIKTDFVVSGKEVFFKLGSYDHSKTLVIDPAIVWSSYFGAAGTDRGLSTAVDNSGNVYLAGSTDSPSGIAVGGFQTSFTGNSHGYLAKFNSAGVLQWSTYYGGHPNAYQVGVACDASGNVFLAGSTSYTSGIFSGGHQSTFAGGSLDAFLVKFNSAGSRLWGTYYGGNNQDEGNAVCTDVSGNVYLIGIACSFSDIASGGHQNTHGGGTFDAFIAKFNSSGVRQWGSYYGGSGYDYGISCCTDPSGDVYLTGNTFSPNNIASGGFQSALGGSLSSPDMFLVKFSSSGIRTWGTYYGGAGFENATSCCTDGSGNVFLAGMCESGSMALNGHQNTYYGGQPDAMLVKFNSSGARLWATYYGEFGFDAAYGCTADNTGNVYITGCSSSSVNISSLGFQNSIAGSVDAFVAKFNSTGVRLWGSYFGSAGTETAMAISRDVTGEIYFAGTTNYTANIAQGGFQNIYGGGASDAFLVRLCDSPLTPTTITGGTIICSGISTQYSASAVTGVTQYLWSFSSSFAGSSLTNSIALAGQIPGSIAISTIGVAVQNACGQSIQNVITVTINASPSVAINSGSICAGSIFTLNASGASTFAITGNSYTVSPSSTSSYSLTGISNAGCASVNTAVATVSVYAPPTLSLTTGSICLGQSFTLVPTGAVNYSYINGGPVVNPSANTTYSVSGTSAEGCVSLLPAIATVTVHPPVIISVNSGSICEGRSFSIVAQGANTYTISGNQWQVSPATSSSYTINGTGPGNCPALVPAVANVTVMPNPTLNVSASANTVCSGVNVTLTANGANNILWDSLLVGNQQQVVVSTSHVYTVTGKNAFGCVGLQNYTLTVLPLPLLVASSSPTVICAGSTGTLTVSGAVTYSWSNNNTLASQTVNPLSTSVYTVTGTGSNSCTSTKTLQLAVESIPVLTLSLQQKFFCRGEKVTVTVQGAVNYNWNTGATGSLVSVVPLGDTLIYVIGSTGAGCASTDTVKLKVNECTGLKENTFTKTWVVYPNPAGEEIYLKGGFEYPLQLKIISINGAIIRHMQMENESAIDIAELSSGLYIVELQTRSGDSVYQKFVKR